MKLTDSITDWDNTTGETGRTIAVFVVVSGVLLVAFDVIWHDAAFDMQAYGIGIGGILTGLAAYLFGDGKTRPASMTTTTTTMQATNPPAVDPANALPVKIVDTDPVRTTEVPPNGKSEKAHKKTRR